jgi:hypothetical protein
MVIWEYKYVSRFLYEGNVVGFLDTMGAEGWELVSLESQSGGDKVMVFKHPKPDEAPKAPKDVAF